MPFDAEKFLLDHGVPYTTEGKHARPGWVQIACPFCSGNPGWHGGFNVEDAYYNCWRCGHHKLVNVAMTLLSISHWGQAKDLLGPYWTTVAPRHRGGGVPAAPVGELELPTGTGPLKKMHIDYLRGRDFDPHQLVREWGLQGTGPLGDYKFRIIAPVHLDGRLVSYQGRDVTDRRQPKYMACARAQEVLHHKHTLYGVDSAVGDSAIVVEGITDVWRLGPGAVATFGIEFTIQQKVMLQKRFSDIMILFDGDPQAQSKARLLESQLRYAARPGDRLRVVNLALPAGVDPADLDPQELSEIKGYLSRG